MDFRGSKKILCAIDLTLYSKLIFIGVYWMESLQQKISTNFVCQAKCRRPTEFGKKNTVHSASNEVKFVKLMCCLPNLYAARWTAFAKKSQGKLLVKLTYNDLSEPVLKTAVLMNRIQSNSVITITVIMNTRLWRTKCVVWFSIFYQKNFTVIVNKIIRNHGYNEQSWITYSISNAKMAFKMKK